MKKTVRTKWFWAMWLVTVVLLVGATAVAQPAEGGGAVGPLVAAGGEGSGRAKKGWPKHWQGQALKKKTALAPGEAKTDLNTASVDELVRLPGIGRKRAEQIVAMRAKRPFRRITELRRVRGIGKKTLQRLLPLVTLGAAKAAAKAPAKAKRKVRASVRPG